MNEPMVVTIAMVLVFFLYGLYSPEGQIFFIDTKIVIFSLHVATTGFPPLWFYRTPETSSKNYPLIQAAVLITDNRLWALTLVLLPFVFHLGFPFLCKVRTDDIEA